MKEMIKAKSSPWEKFIFGLGNIGANLCWTFLSLYVTMYYTDSVGIAAVTAGTIMLAARLLDGASDVLCAVVFEKCHMKLGKYRPWFLISAPLLGISLYLSFHVPAGISVQMKILWVAVTYIFTAAVSYTIYNLAFASLLSVMSLDEKDREKTSSVVTFMTTAAMVVMSMATPVLLVRWGGEASQGAWSRISTIYAVLCTACVLLIGIFVTEKINLNKESGAMQEKGKKEFSKLLKIVMSNKYMWLLLALFILYFLYTGSSAMFTYYYKDVLGDLSLYSMGSMISMLPQIIMFIILPFILGRVDKNKAVFFGILSFVAGNVIFLAAPRNIIVAYVSAAIKSAGITPLMAVIYAYIPELVDYISRKNQVNTASIVSMASSIGQKVGSGIGSALVGWMLGWFGYQQTAVVQSSLTQTGIIISVAVVPMAFGILMLVILHFWDIGKEEDR